MSDQETLDPARFTCHVATPSGRPRLAYLHEGDGYPLVLLHGYPETKRIWWRNVAPLAEMGFAVIVPDLRGFGDSDIPDDGWFDPAAMARDVHALVTEVLGHQRCAVVAGDLGSAVALDMALRFPQFVERQVIFNGVLPMLPDLYGAAGIAPDPPRRSRPSADYFMRQGLEADALIAELSTPATRHSYVSGFYGHRLWASPGSFSRAAVDFMVEPFLAEQRLRASWGAYEVACGRRPASEPALLDRPSPVPTLALFGPEDHVVSVTFPERCGVAFTDCMGPFVVPGAGHFLQWERADVLNRAIRHFLLPRR